MERKELVSLMTGALLNRDANVNFADSNEAIKNALMEFYGVSEDMDYKSVKRALHNDFSIIEDVIDEVLPRQLENIMGDWATIISFDRNAEVVYKIKNLGHRRAMLGIAPGARSGMYKAYRLDGKNLSIPTRTYTAGTAVSLEDILLGRLTLGEMMNDILQGIQYQVYKDIVKALRTIKTKAPVANRKTAAGFVATDMDSLIRVVGSYGTPVLVCFESFAAKISNTLGQGFGYTPNVPSHVADELWNRGYVSAYKGTNVIVIPNFILDETTNEDWMFSEADCFVLPTGEKPVIVAMRGDSVVVDHALPSGGEEQQLSKMMGTAIIAYNNLGVYTDSQIATSENGLNRI